MATFNYSSSTITTAAPQGNEGYEHFVSKGSCRRCGLTAYGKRKCHHCLRKFCRACAPAALQKYGEQIWEECCVGCEPCLVIPIVGSEPIFELEPESEDVATFASMSPHQISGIPPIRVPLSATCSSSAEEEIKQEENEGCAVNSKSSSCSSSTLSTDVNSDLDQEGSESSSQLDRCSDYESSPFYRETEVQNQRRPASAKGYCASCDRYGTGKVPCPTCGISASASAGPNGFPDSAPFCPLMPEPGCCTSCHNYSKGKQPCLHCGAKYCAQSECLAHLYDNGTCAKCVRSAPLEPIAVRPPDVGCCTACQQYDAGKIPCSTCGTKYCQEEACQVYRYSNGTCVRCRSNKDRG